MSPRESSLWHLLWKLEKRSSDNRWCASLPPVNHHKPSVAMAVCYMVELVGLVFKTLPLPWLGRKRCFNHRLHKDTLCTQTCILDTKATQDTVLVQLPEGAKEILLANGKNIVHFGK